jgi:hypothetical protein
MNFRVNRTKDGFITFIYIDPLIFVMIYIIVVKPISKGNINYGKELPCNNWRVFKKCLV